MHPAPTRTSALLAAFPLCQVPAAPAVPVVPPTALITNDAVVLGLLIAVLYFVMETSSRTTGFWGKFYRYLPPLLLCYFIPAVFNSFGLISGTTSGLYSVATGYLLPASLVLLTLNIDFKTIRQLGPKALIMFTVGAVSIMLGGPIGVWVMSMISPEVVGGNGPDAVWKGLATVAGSWIGGGANQVAMKEIFEPSDRLFSAVIAVDVILAYLWMALLLYGASIVGQLDKRMGADTSAIDEVRRKIENYRASIARIPNFLDWVRLIAIAFIPTAVAHLCADGIVPWIDANAPVLAQFSMTSRQFWIVIITTTFGLLFSFTRAKKLEGVGASRLGTLLLYMMIVVIGMRMDLFAIADQPGLLVVGAIWLVIHAVVMLVTARLIRAPFFFMAVSSQSLIGGPASAPVVASAFHPSLAPVGVLLAILGYAVGTYGAYLCALMMRAVAP
jgi:uncharacterized membrane protein